MYLLENVPLESLGHPRFAAAASERRLCGLSLGARGWEAWGGGDAPIAAVTALILAKRGLESGSCLALLGGRLVAALAGPSFQRLGLEEPLPGTFLLACYSRLRSLSLSWHSSGGRGIKKKLNRHQKEIK